MTGILLWDREGVPPSHDGQTALWRSYGMPALPDAISVPRLVEASAHPLRERYLAWVHDLGETLVDGRKLVDSLALRPGLSYWWLTSLVEKCNYEKSPWIDTAIKLMAFEEWARGRSFAKLTLVSSDRALARCLELWCRKNGTRFECEFERAPLPAASAIRRLYARLPAIMRGAIFLIRYVSSRWSLRGAGVEAWRRSSGRLCFVSYFFNLAPAALAAGRYECHNWGPLPGMLEADGIAANFLHIYVKSELSPAASHAARALRRLNEAPGSRQAHVALDSFLGVRVLVRSLRDWFGVMLKAGGLERQAARTTSRGLQLWPLFAGEWRETTVGGTGLGNLLCLNLFEAAMAALPRQSLAVYLLENQGWEAGLLHAWKAAGHGPIVGFPHSTLRFWDLRYYYDARSYARSCANPLPRPDKYAVSGPAALRACIGGSYPNDGLVPVEALRYLYLGRPVRTCAGALNGREPLRLLVLTDYSSRSTGHQLRLLEQSVRSFGQAFSIKVKPHPACPVAPSEYPGLSMTVTTEPVGEALRHCDIAYASAVTSAAVDAYCAGVPVVVALDGETVNQSPLMGCAGVRFAGTPEDLARAVAEQASQPGESRAGDYFDLDAGLPKWKRLVGEALHL
ncbi:MAG: TIGR04326 family surface carbohydrate biosynthesis protein [Ignavibacteria bacterium]